MILLDTHTFLWFVNDPSQLPPRVNQLIEETENVYVSIASFWEMTIKSSKGKLELPTSITKMMLDCQTLGLTILPIKGNHLEHLSQLPWIHKDPFDRLLICQAQSEELTLLTVDENIQKNDDRTAWEQ